MDELAPIALPAAGTNAGAMARLFLLEAKSPGQPDYVAGENLIAMRLMRQVIANRLKSPRQFAADGATTETDIIELGNQFAGFSAYPTLPPRMVHNLSKILEWANDPKWPHRKAYRDFVQDAVTASTEALSAVGTRYPNVTAWRTAGSGSPGPRFVAVATVSGNTFYSTLPISKPHHHGRRR